MEPLELRPGPFVDGVVFGRVTLDDAGIARHGVLRTHALAWDAITDYRLTIEFHGTAPRILYLADELLGTVLQLVDAVRGALGKSEVRYALELRGGDTRVAFDYMFAGAERAIGQCLHRVQPALLASARAAYAARGEVQIGPLTLGRDALTWAGCPPLPRAHVESIEVFDGSDRAQLRVVARGKSWPYGSEDTERVPSVLVVLALAHELGYPVRGARLLAALGNSRA